MFFAFSRMHLRASYFSIGGAFIFLLWVFFVFRSSGVRSERVKQVKVVAVDATSNRATSAPVVDFDSASYYQPIIKYNLFRPLGWTPPVPREPYRLIGTVLPRSANSPPRAIIKSTEGNTRHIVSIGDNLDTNTQVVEIRHKQVVLETDGKQRTLRLSFTF